MAEHRLRLLCLDGGGVRGLASLYLLKQLLSFVGHPKPCMYFDMICGTSTGGLIAIMLGRLEMTIDECITAYIQLMGSIFKREHHLPFSITKGKVQPRFSTKELESSIKRVITDAGFPAEAPMRGSKETSCKVFVVAMTGLSKDIVHITDYAKVGEQNDFYDKIKIWQAARATSAATSFFAPLDIDGRTFLDGGLGANNPVDRLWLEARSQFGPASLEPQIRCLLSIGTGKPALTAFGESVKEVGKSLISIATETQRTADSFHENHEDLAIRDGYFRFNPPDMDEVGMEEAGKKAIIMDRTEAYGRDPVIKLFMRRFQQIVGEEQRRFTAPTTVPLVPTRPFYELDKRPKYIQPNVRSYWHHLTLPAYELYEKIYRSCKDAGDHRGGIHFLTFMQQFSQARPSPRKNEEVWARLLRDKRRVRDSRHPQGFVMAVLYMLHIEKYLEDERPLDESKEVGVDNDRREALKRFNKWVPCQCSRSCGTEWNFANDIGLQRGDSTKKLCGVAEFLRRGTLRNLFASQDGEALKSMRDKWGTARFAS